MKLSIKIFSSFGELIIIAEVIIITIEDKIKNQIETFFIKYTYH